MLSAVIKIVLTMAAVGIAVFICLVLLHLAGLFRNLKNEVIPMARRLERTIDEINLELQRLDDIVKTGEEVVDKVSATAKLAQEAISSPLVKLVSYGAGIKRAIDIVTKKKEEKE